MQLRKNEPISLNTDIFADFSENTLDLSNDNEEESETELNESKSVEDLDLRLSESELEWALRKIHQVEKDPNVILQIGEFNYMPNNECYQLLISDGK